MNSAHDKKIGEMVRALREHAGWTQTQLAERAALSHHQTVSAIEKGDRSLKASELVQLAELFHVEVHDLLTGRTPRKADLVFWRESMDPRARSDEESVFLMRCRRFAFLERLSDEGPNTTLQSYSLDPEKTRYEDVERWAERFGKAHGLGEVPALSLRRILEEHVGVKVFIAPLKGGSGAAARGDFGDAVLENAEEINTRRAFSLGHELFHLLTWEAVTNLLPGQDSRNEQLANVFASALLLPSSGIRERIGTQPVEEWQWHRFLSLADAFAVSPTAFLWRLKNMGLLSESRLKELLSSSRRGDQFSPCQADISRPEPELPRRFILLAYRAWADGLISIGKFAEVLETTVGMLEPRLAEYGLNLDWDADATTALSS